MKKYKVKFNVVIEMEKVILADNHEDAVNQIDDMVLQELMTCKVLDYSVNDCIQVTVLPESN